MKKKLTMMLLALVVALGGTSVAVMSGCNPTEDKPGPSQTAEYTVKFTVNGEEVGKQTVKHGETLQDFAVPAKPGYTGAWVDAAGNAIDFAAAITADAEYVAQYTANTDTEYKTEYYFENVDGDYELDAALTNKLTGTTDTAVTAEGVTKEHYELDETAEGTVKEGTIAGDGSLTLKLYYKLERVTVTFIANGVKIDEQEVRYGAKATATDKPVPAKDQTDAEEYTFNFWAAVENDETPFNWNEAVTDNLTVYAVYKKETRKYDVVADFNNPLFYFANANGVELSEIKNVPYGDTVMFTINNSRETAGTAVVTVKTTNSAGTTEAVATPDENDVYTITVNGNVEIIISGLVVKTYNVTIGVSGVINAPVWAAPYGKIDDVKFEVTEEGKAAVTADVKIENGLAKFTWTAGKYSVRAFVEENGSKKYISKAVTAEVDAFSADDDGNYAFADGIILSAPVETIWNQTAQIGKDGSVMAENGKAYSLTFADFAPGNNDFAITVTYDQLMSDENKRPHGDPTGDQGATNDPSIGFTFFSGEDKLEIPLYDAGAIRVFENNVMMLEHRSMMAKAGSLLGRLEWPDCYRHAELTYVKVNGWLYIVISANGDAGCYSTGNTWYASTAKTYVNFVPAMIDLENGILYARKGYAGTTKDIKNGLEYPSTEKVCEFNSTFMKNVLTNITSAYAEFAFGDGKSYGVMSGYGYTSDAKVLAEMEKSIKSEFSITSNLVLADIELKVDGADYNGPEVLGFQQTRTVTFKVPAGKIIAKLTVGGKDVAYELDGNLVTVVVSTEETAGNKALAIELVEGRDAVISGTVAVEGDFAGKDQLDNVMARFISDTGRIIRAAYDKETKKFSASVPAGSWKLFVTNGYVCSETTVQSVVNKDATVDVKLNSLASVGAIGINNGGLTDNGDGTYSVQKVVGGTQENAMKNVSFVPGNEILEFGFTVTGLTTQGQAAGGLWPLIGMFVKSADGGMWRITWCNAGDQMAQMPVNDIARYAVTDTRDVWVPFGDPSGWYTFDKPNYKLTVKIQLDGYNVKVFFKTGEETEWKNVAFDNGDTMNIYDFWNQETTNKSMFNGIKNRSEYLNTLYKLDQECQFGISVRRDAADNDVNLVKMSDIWYNITAKN